MGDRRTTIFHPKEHSGQPHTEPKINQQTNKTIRHTCIAIVQDTQTQQLVNPHKLELIRDKYEYMRKPEQHYSEQLIPSSQRSVNLMMAGCAATCSNIQ
jgi:hypothetical protein